LAVVETQNYPIEAFDRTLRMNLRSAFLQTPEELRDLPQGKLRLDHSKEGLDNKQTQTIM
jgi:hypothetical protein